MCNHIKKHDTKYQAASVRLENSPTPHTAYKTMNQILKKKRDNGPGGHIKDEATHTKE
jgi:hypothetical protein